MTLDIKTAQIRYDAANAKVRAAMNEMWDRYYDLIVVSGKDNQPWFNELYDFLPPEMKVNNNAKKEAAVEAARKRVFDL